MKKSESEFESDRTNREERKKIIIGKKWRGRTLFSSNGTANGYGS